MNESIKARILKHALECFPRECCGLVIRENGIENYIPCRNTASNRDQFALAPEDYVRAENKGEIVAVVHSHPNNNDGPSDEDNLACLASGHVWIIVSVPEVEWWKIEPSSIQVASSSTA